MRLNQLREKLRSNLSEATKVEIKRLSVKKRKARGAITCSKAQWYEFGEKDNKHFDSKTWKNQTTRRNI